MPQKSHTILILPGGGSRFRRVRVSSRFLFGAAAAVVLALVAAMSAPHLALKLRNSSRQVSSVEQHNAALRAEAGRFEAEVAELNDRLDRFEAVAGKLARELGVEDPIPAAAGGDSAGIAAAVPEILGQDLQALSARTRGLEESLENLDTQFQKRMRLLASRPGIMPVRGWYSHGFGWRKDPWTGSREFHRGIDIVADKGTEVRATADGFVSRANRQPDYGKVVDLSHGQGYVTRYAHMSELLVRPGQRVERGQVIGRVGSTGRSTGPHLHYEVFRDGRRVNPWKYLGEN